jgi:putative phosphoesterase
MGAQPITKLGVIADTHGLLRREALDGMRGCARIIHGGDIGGPEILDTLAEIAPVTAVRGNNDTAPWAARLNESELLEVDEVRIHVIHDVSQLHGDPARRGIHVVVSGHSHKPAIAWRDGVLYVNPGSAGPRRFKLPVAVALIEVIDAAAAGGTAGTLGPSDARVCARIVELASGG